MREPRLGGAVTLVLMLVLALTALAHTAFLVALEETAASHASVAVLQARLLAEGAVRRAVRGLGSDTLPSPGDSAATLLEGGAAGARFRADLRRLARELYWLEGMGRVAVRPGGPERVEDRTARLLWSASPVERVGAFVAAVEHGGAVEAPFGAIDVTSPRARGELPAPAGCRDRGDALDEVGGWLSGAARTLSAVPERLPELGLLAHDSLLARIAPRAAGVVVPGPRVEEGVCVISAPLNWGSPSAPGGACGGHRPAVAAEGDLWMRGGEGQGILAVTGDLRLTDGARYAGLLLVGGDLTLEGGALVEGLLRVRGTVRVAPGASVVGRYCPALLALEGAASLRRPLQLPGAGWIRPL